MDNGKIILLGKISKSTATILAAEFDAEIIVTTEIGHDAIKRRLEKYGEQTLSEKITEADFSAPKERKKDKFPPARFLHRKK